MIREQLARIQRTFVGSIVGLVLVTMLTLASALIIVDGIQYNKQISATNIESLTATYPEVAAYLESQKAASPHFVTIANLVKQDQQAALAKAFILVSVPIIIASLVFGYVLARRLLRPVADSYEARDRFIQDAAHELRNPLAAMAATIETAQANPRQSEQTRKIMTRLERQTNRLIKINEDLLFLQRAAEPFSGTTDLAKLTNAIVEDFVPVAADKSIEINTEIAPRIRAQIRPRDYEILVRNLLDNAIKYSPERSMVRVVLQSQPRHLTLTVSDQGIGIPADEQAKIFNRFYRASNTTGISGSGLGLALVDKVLVTYQGNLKIKSTPGKGASFIVTLPVLS